MVEVEIDGRKVEVAEGSMVMHAAAKLDIYVPHFCYHKKLSIAANCRMCLVDVEKAPKPLPACATPVTNGMKVSTRSERAVKAQQAVMEFLLINHPLDCPICDQGGECQLQDLALGYGGSASRYTEEKRVVFHKSIGPLISAEEMSRCIHCTRCVRFGQEIAGQMELGMAGRGEHSEIMSFLGRSVDSELSGNMIDLCPVGALTSKPFRYSARTWELARRKSVAPHDSLGSNLVVQVKHDRVMRVVPLENEAINQCWLSDRDRFSYEAIHSQDRLLKPMLKQDGRWQEVEWSVAIDYVSHALSNVVREAGAARIGALACANSTLEELALLAQLMRGLGSDNIDTRLRQTDFSLDALMAGTPWLGLPIAEIDALDGLVAVGSFLRKDHPLLSARLRQATRRGMRLGLIHAVADDVLMPVAAQGVLAPSQWVSLLQGVLVAVCRAAGAAVPAELSALQPDSTAQALADVLLSGEQRAIMLGNAAVQHAEFGSIALLAQSISQVCGARFGYLVEGANAVGAWQAGARPLAGGLNARTMLESPLAAYLLLNLEPSLDHAYPVQARKALEAAQTVISLTAYRSPELMDLADCLLPVSTFAETAGTFVNCEGRAQSFNGVVPAPGEARPAWKVLRVLANSLELPGFEYESSEAVRNEVGAKASALDNAIAAGVPVPALGSSSFDAADCFERIADVPIYSADPIVRRAPSLQRTGDAASPVVRINPASMAALGFAQGQRVRVTQSGGEAILELAADASVAEGVARIAAACEATATLPAMVGTVRLAKA